ncbi:MAG: GTPase [Phycisphaerales bacterium]
MTVAGAPASFTLATPAPGSGDGAIAAFMVQGDAGELDRALAALCGRAVPVGAWGLRDLGGIDRGVVARWSRTHASIMPHAGPEIVRQLAAKLAALGLTSPAAASVAFPEAGTDIESHMLSALACAASPLAVDLLLDQPRRWRQEVMGATSAALSEGDAQRSCALNRLIHPPLVVAIGPPNVGKSTLMNALADRELAATADEPGTTRDHVGASIDLAGLVVCWMDAPGLNPRATDIDLAAQHAALAAAASADLILLCGDAGAGFVPNPHPSVPAIKVGLRMDRGPAPGAAVAVAALRGDGLADLVSAVREALVPAAAMNHPGPWRFW